MLGMVIDLGSDSWKSGGNGLWNPQELWTREMGGCNLDEPEEMGLLGEQRE